MLRNQLHQYKELIKQRVSDTTPVITFQDIDTDVGCIEEFSSCHDNVPEPQKDVRAVKYEDLLISW